MTKKSNTYGVFGIFGIFGACNLCSWSWYKKNIMEMKILWKFLLIISLIFYFTYTIIVSLDFENKKYLIQEGLRNREGIYTNLRKMNNRHIVRPIRRKINHHIQILKTNLKKIKNKII
jgi:hypothetical protein